MCICWRWEDTIYFRPPGFSKWKIVFSWTSSQNFLDSKNFLTKTLFLLRHLMPLIPEMVWVPLCSTLKPLLLWVTQITLFSTPFQYKTLIWIGSVNRIDKSLLGGFLFFLVALKARHPSLWMVFRHHTTTSAYPLDRYQASRCLDYDKAYRRFNSLFLNSDKVKTHGE